VRSLPWITTRNVLRPGSHDGFAFATPFSVAGFGTREKITEFGDEAGWIPQPSSRHQLSVEARLTGTEHWSVVAEFGWWAPPTHDLMRSYIAHRNSPSDSK
jgi:hypothetical protein